MLKYIIIGFVAVIVIMIVNKNMGGAQKATTNYSSIMRGIPTK